MPGLRVAARALIPAMPGPTIWFEPLEWHPEQPRLAKSCWPLAASPAPPLGVVGAAVGCAPEGVFVTAAVGPTVVVGDLSGPSPEAHAVKMNAPAASTPSRDSGLSRS